MSQLKPQDLRYGNLIEAQEKIFIVKAIEAFIVSATRGKGNVDFTYAEVNPIPLTEEILLMAGFEKLNNTTFKFKDLILDYISTEEHFETEIKYIYGGYKLIPMKYLNTVQNFIFTMYNEELEINLK